MTALTYRDGVAIGEIVVYIPLLIIAIILASRHGFGRSSGWLFLILFSLIRIIGSCFQLATVNDRANVSLYVGIAILQNVGLSPLELISIGLLSRIIASINKSKPTIVRPYHLKITVLLLTIALVLGITGGSNSSGNFAKTGQYVVSSLTKVAMGLLIATYVLIIIFTILVSANISAAEPGEKRVLLAVALPLPLLLVRLIYSSVYTFGGHKTFSSLSGSVTLFLVMGLLMELLAIIIYSGIGLTLGKVQNTPVGDTLEPQSTSSTTTHRRQRKPIERNTNAEQPSVGRQIADFLGKRTLIGRLVVRLSGGGNYQERDVEMNGYQRQ